MAGIRQINTPAETFRFPEWRDDMFFAADSVVRYAAWMSDSDGSLDLKTKFYIAAVDIASGTGAPPLNPGKWSEAFAGSLGIAQYVQDIIDNDSDIQALRVAFANHDSDSFVKFHNLDELDSDIQVRIDSDFQNQKDRDSDIRVLIDSEIQARKDADSDMRVDHDSDLAALLGADSDLLHDLDSEIQARKDADSDIIEHFDSDLRVLDSDIHSRIDSEIQARKDADSDIIEHFDSDLRSLDSEIRRLLDSEYISRKDFDSEIRYDLDSEVKRIVRGYIEADSDQTIESIINVTMYDSDSEGPSNFLRKHQYALSWDSDLNKWRPQEAASRVSNLKDVTLLDSDDTTSMLQDGYALTWDSDFSIWRPKETASRVSNLKDVDLTDLGHHSVLRYDSDSSMWKTAYDTTTVIKQKTETFIATEGQSRFDLAETPIGDVNGARMGIEIAALAFIRDSEGAQYVLYDSDQNNFQRMDAGDRIDLSYIYATTQIETTTIDDALRTKNIRLFADVSDSDFIDGQVFVWSAAKQIFEPAFAPAGAAPTVIDGGAP